MKQLIFLLFCVSISAFGQEKEKKPTVEFEPGFHIGWALAMPVGDTALSDGYNPGSGLNMQLDLLNYRNVLLGVGVTGQIFSVTDQAVVGEYHRGSYSSAYLAVSYKHKFSKKWVLLPSVGMGFNRFRLRETTNLSPSHQKGREIRVGSTLNFKLDGAVWLYTGAFYTWSKMGMNTTSEFDRYYSDFSHVQFQVGIYFF
ncbi:MULTISPECIES: hypothetical protein [unclassified Flavobacterium]|uniref:hypothetical protein n=1 Tax=unclassified Flavobacterium TaxID=196869 RepID=UPI001F13E3D0|nr:MULTISPECIES: hypothetical protein [unclassified Flavobacterium]UMY64419.1 hypothetical protein MKO97_07835 [Flavobacterium sp. HJ-32-4]